MPLVLDVPAKLSYLQTLILLKTLYIATPTLPLRAFSKWSPSQLEALKPFCIMKFPFARFVPNGFLTCLPRRTSKSELKFPSDFWSILTTGFRNIITGDETWIHFFTV